MSNLVDNIDSFIEQRLKTISKLRDLNSLDKDSLKNFSKLIFERNQMVENEVILG